MATTKPYGGSSQDRVVELINYDNDSNFVYGTDFTFGAVSADDGPGGRNTKLRLIPTNQEQYGQQDIRYWRLPLSVLDYLPQEFIRPVRLTSLPFRIHDVLDEINDALGLDLTRDEVINDEYNLPQEKYALRIAGVNASMAWLYSTYDFAVEAPFLSFRYTTDGKIRRLTTGEPRLIAK